MLNASHLWLCRIFSLLFAGCLSDNRRCFYFLQLLLVFFFLFCWNIDFGREMMHSVCNRPNGILKHSINNINKMICQMFSIPMIFAHYQLKGKKVGEREKKWNEFVLYFILQMKIWEWNRGIMFLISISIIDWMDHVRTAACVSREITSRTQLKCELPFS